MEMRELGNTGLAVSVLGLGTVKLGRNRNLKHRSFDLPDDRTVRRLFDTARELGINLLDTAPAYGNSESRLGELLKHQGRRSEWILCTKVGEEFSRGASTFDYTPAHVRYSIERSLDNLRTDYLDLVVIHSNGEDLKILDDYGTLDALRDLQTRGLVRGTGISHKTPAGALAALKANCDVIMATLSVRQRAELDVIKQAALQGTGVLIKKPLASGIDDPRNLGWVASQPGVGSVIVGTLNPEHLRENAQWLHGGFQPNPSAPSC